jgi:hypothetical protein
MGAMAATTGFGADWLAGVADPPHVHDAAFFQRWLGTMPGDTVELMCHPGHEDIRLLNRPGEPGAQSVRRRTAEYALLASPSFREAAEEAGFVLTRPSSLLPGRLADAA